MKKLDIVFEDNHVIVVNKPQNILSQSDITKDADMLSLVKAYVKEKYNKQGNVFIGLVHRLDRPTGGLMVFARNSKSASRLALQMKDGQFKKEYLAVVENTVKQSQKQLVNYIKKDEKTNLVKLCPQTEMGAKKAVLEYKLLAKENGLTLLNVQIKTGRPHQIRVQLASIKNAIYGDFKYGASQSQKTENLALWAYKLEFLHPVSKTKMKFTSLPPENIEPWYYFNLERFL